MDEAKRTEVPMRVVNELWSYREFLGRLVAGDLEMRYQRSVIGLAWTLVDPLFTVIVLVLVFNSGAER